MTRRSKQERRRAVSFRKPRYPAEKTGPKKDQLEHGHKVHLNALEEGMSLGRFIPKMVKRA